MRNLFSIIITTRNRHSMLINELNCLSMQTYKNFHVYIVDDNSSDQTQNIDLDYYGESIETEIFHSKIGLNMIRARNKGLSMADKTSDYFVILDDDNQFNNDFLEKLNNFVNKYSDFGLIGLKNYNRDRKSILNFGCDYNLSTMLPHFVKKEFSSDFIEVDSAANCLIIKKDIILKIGYFDERYVIDLSETEFCFRAKEIGYRLVTANIPIFHQSTSNLNRMEEFSLRIRERPETYFYTFRNKFLIVSEFGSFWNKVLFFMFWQFLTLFGYFYISIKTKEFKLFALYSKGFFAGNYYLITNKLKFYE